MNMTDTTGNFPFFAITAVIGAVVGAVVGGIVAAKNGGNVWAGIGIGAAATGISGSVTEAWNEANLFPTVPAWAPW